MALVPQGDALGCAGRHGEARGLPMARPSPPSAFALVSGMLNSDVTSGCHGYNELSTFYGRV